MKINDLEFFLVAVGQTDSPVPIHSLLVRVTTTHGIEAGESRGSLGVSASLPRDARPCWPCWPAEAPTISRNCTRSKHSRRRRYGPRWKWPSGTSSAGGCGNRSAIFSADTIDEACPSPFEFQATRHPRRPPSSANWPNRAFIPKRLPPSVDRKTISEPWPAVREMVGDRIELRFDGMASYDMETARDLSAGMEPHGLQFLVDPLQAKELHPVASLGRQTSVPLAVWRSIHGPADVLAAVRHNAASFLVVDLEQGRRHVPARVCAAIAEAAGVVPVLAADLPSESPPQPCSMWPPPRQPFRQANELASRQLRDTVLTDPLPIPRRHDPRAASNRSGRNGGPRQG